MGSGRGSLILAMPSKRVFIYGSHAAANLINSYTESAERTGYVVRQSLISAMNGPSNVTLDASPGQTTAGLRQVRDDAAASLPSTLEYKATTLDFMLWDLADERFGVHSLTDGTFLTASPQLKKSVLHGASAARHIKFGSREHLSLWKTAADRMVELLTKLGLKSKTFVLRMPWAGVDENGDSVEHSFGQSSREANTAFKPYYRHLRRRGIRIIRERRGIGSANHPRGPSPLNLLDSQYHCLAGQLAKALSTTSAAPVLDWNWDSQHNAPILHWTDPGQLDVTVPGRTEHCIAPRPAFDEEFPARFLVQNTGSDTLLVISHGALPRGKYKVPRFEFLSTLESREENLLFLADGALAANDQLELAWFTGSEHDDLTARFSWIAQRVADQLGAHKILFLGGSGGGFASVNLAASTPGSRALVFNPQTIIRRYWAKSVSIYQKTLFPEIGLITQLDKLGRRVSLVDRVTEEPPSSYQIIYVQNDDDTFHIENHLTPFAKKLQMLPKTSESSSGNVQLIVEPFASGHNMPYREVLNAFVDLSLQDWGSPLSGWDRSTYGHLLTVDEGV